VDECKPLVVGEAAAAGGLSQDERRRIRVAAEEHALLPAARQNSRHRSGRCVAVPAAAAAAAFNALSSTSTSMQSRSSEEEADAEDEVAAVAALGPALADAGWLLNLHDPAWAARDHGAVLAELLGVPVTATTTHASAYVSFLAKGGVNGRIQQISLPTSLHTFDLSIIVFNIIL